MRLSRAKKKNNEANMTVHELTAATEKRREADRERARKYRLVKKLKSSYGQSEDQSEKSGPSTLSETVAQSYNNIQTLGKAVKKVSRALPVSPRMKRAILAHIVSNLNNEDKQTVVNVVANPIFKRTSMTLSTLIKEIHKFFERDDISRVSPKTKDVKTYKCPETGEELSLPTRHLTLSIKEARALFMEKRKKNDLGMSTLLRKFFFPYFVSIYFFIFRMLWCDFFQTTSSTTRKADQ